MSVFIPNVLVADMLHKGFKQEDEEWWYLTTEGWESIPAIKVHYSPAERAFRDAVLEYNKKFGVERTLKLMERIPEHLMLDEAAAYVKLDYQIQEIAAAIN